MRRTDSGLDEFRRDRSQEKGSRQGGLLRKRSARQEERYDESLRSSDRYPDEQSRTSELDDRTRIFGPMNEVDDRTRVFRTTKQQEQLEEEYRRASYERRKVQSEDLQDDNTSDQLADDIPFSRFFRKN